MNNRETRGLADMLAGFIDQSLERGMSLPLLLTAVAVNGSVVHVRYKPAADGLAPEVLAEHFVGGMFALPINIMIVDASGEAARVVIDKSGNATFH